MPDLIPQPIVEWLQHQSLTLGTITPLSGGCVADIAKLSLQTSKGAVLELVLKQMPEGSSEQGAAEAGGLESLRLSGPEALCTPKVILQEGLCLLLEYLTPVEPSTDFDEHLGRGLAFQHHCKNDRFGFAYDTFCGNTRQLNHWHENGFDFYARQRYQALGQQCLAQGLITTALFEQLLTLSESLYRWLPEQPAVLLHGDLWSGNIMTGSQGEPALIDPSVYYGWAEAELAMTQMFGGFSQRLYQAYQYYSDVQPDWRSRSELYNLYHYLNHLLLFGGAYHRDVERIVKYYSG
ncbi:fructosamine kinase family protein [Amphritea japonica]|uniref:Fructosamine/ketosamine-3-kinase n=1 Tax=Amphritea japonica ATCC BAA-1530 TaxID=1278309 RepID=A0A7R6P7Q6_9GAMM|nr:fructosamine kinase family protein [Amphritea japonica]BBB27459.1 fructosamine/ketosamine-3-kinase [Amphritea japonica ATCC BAA-1530]